MEITTVIVASTPAFETLSYFPFYKILFGIFFTRPILSFWCDNRRKTLREDVLEINLLDNSSFDSLCRPCNQTNKSFALPKFTDPYKVQEPSNIVRIRVTETLLERQIASHTLTGSGSYINYRHMEMSVFCFSKHLRRLNQFSFAASFSSRTDVLIKTAN